MGMGRTAADGTSHTTKREREVREAAKVPDRTAIRTALANRRRV